jgi:hypothetical protein
MDEPAATETRAASESIRTVYPVRIPLYPGAMWSLFLRVAQAGADAKWNPAGPAQARFLGLPDAVSRE